VYIDGHELGEYYFSEAGHAIIHEMDGQGPLGYRVIPARPALVLRGLRFELALQGESPSFDFGEYDHLGNISFFASVLSHEFALLYFESLAKIESAVAVQTNGLAAEL
jgi:hypothetical protein